MQTLSLLLLGLLPALILADMDIPNQIHLRSRSKIFDGERIFSIEMLKQIRKYQPNGNLFFSPFSAYNALLLAYFSASGETESQLRNGLNLGWASSKSDVNSAYMVGKRLDMKRQRRNKVELNSANHIFLDKKVTLQKKFKNLLPEEIEQKDFENEPEKSLQEINGWIADQTKNQIRDMLSSEEITTNTKLVLANAAYMKGQWLSQFDVKNTTSQPFFITPHQSVMVPMMRQKGTFKMNMNENLQVQILEVPFRTLFEAEETPNSTPEDKSDISMVLILPSSNQVSINDVVNRLESNDLINLIEKSMPREVDLSMPKFQFEQRTKLTPILGNMGITQLFGNTANLQDLTPDYVYFDDAQHLAKIKVDERGSTAAAATIMFSARSARPADPSQFNCNHPFLFIIYDRKVRTILFAGIYSDPKTMQ